MSNSDFLVLAYDIYADMGYVSHAFKSFPLELARLVL